MGRASVPTGDAGFAPGDLLGWGHPSGSGAPGPAVAPLELSPRVEAAPPCPSPGITFLIFAGKGGVGKTTLACATAVRLAQAFSGKEILLFSTDPAHSLAACLEEHMGSEPVRLAPGLTAMEIDAPGEFTALKKQYQTELANFLQTAVGKFRPSLRPPGTGADAGPVPSRPGRNDGPGAVHGIPEGGPLRDLDLGIRPPPAIFSASWNCRNSLTWLKTFFGLLLKYRLTFRFLNLSQEMVRISRNLKFLRTLW